jgi:hypothetical protein
MKSTLGARLARIAAACLALACASTPAHAADRVHRYLITVEPDLGALNAEACFAGAAPAILVAESLDAPAALVSARVARPAGRALPPNGPELKLRDLPEDGCIEYRVSFSGNQTRHDFSGNSTRKVGRDLFTEVGLWFWRPPRLGEDEQVEISFRMPESLAVSAPWRPLPARDGLPTYRVGRGAHDRPSAVAFGQFRERHVEVPGATLRMAVLDGTPRPDLEAMSVWIEDAARSVAAVYGRFPVPSPQILVMPGARATEPAPWAYVLRGGQAAAHFFVNQRRPLAEYVEDWTAPHELSHLLLPYINSSDAWLSEGLASYYQNVTRARSGAITPAEAWQRMHTGFKRGRDWGVKEGQSLAQATERMFRDGGHMRVYWHGAAILLMADVALRERSGNAQSLDTVLEAFGRCCLDPDVEWTARKVFTRFDELAGGSVFLPLLEREVRSSTFADLGPLYDKLGLEALGGKLGLRSSAPGIAIRDAIMAPGPYQTPAALLTGRR